MNVYIIVWFHFAMALTTDVLWAMFSHVVRLFIASQTCQYATLLEYNCTMLNLNLTFPSLNISARKHIFNDNDDDGYYDNVNNITYNCNEYLYRKRDKNIAYDVWWCKYLKHVQTAQL